MIICGGVYLADDQQGNVICLLSISHKRLYLCQQAYTILRVDTSW